MNKYPFVFIGGYGCNDSYCKKFIKYMKPNYKIYFIPILHNDCSFENQVNRIYNKIKNIKTKINLLGFSTSCTICLRLLEKYPDRINKLLLLNPASLYFRLTNTPELKKYNLLPSNTKFIKNDILNYLNNYSILSFLYNFLNYFTIFTFITSLIYYLLIGYYENEPFNSIYYIFSIPYKNTKKCLINCLLDVNIWQLLRNTKNYNNITIFVGINDFYYPLTNLISEQFLNIKIVRLLGNHHIMITNPEYICNKINLTI